MAISFTLVGFSISIALAFYGVRHGLLFLTP